MTLQGLVMAGTYGGSALLVLGFLAAVWKGVRGVWRFMRKVNNFIDDLNGEPARDGVPERPGLMRRMEAVEQTMRGHLDWHVDPTGGLLNNRWHR